MNHAELAARFLLQGWSRRLTGQGPIFTTLFVTSRCNARCGHCFYRETMNERAGRGELSLAELTAVARSMPPFTKLLVSGGEPFLRTDLAEICEAFHRHAGVRQVTIPTNAALSDAVVSTSTQLARRCPRLAVQLQISIDGVGADHDRIRGIPGGFDALRETVARLTAAQPGLPNLEIIFNFTLTAETWPHLPAVCAFLEDELGTHRLHMGTIRGRPFDPATKHLDPARHAEAVETMAAFLARGRDGDGPVHRFFEQLMAARRSVTMDRIRRTRDGSWPGGRCSAGKLSVVIQEQGDVYVCELLERPVGNLRDVELDFGRLWRGHELSAIRREIREACCSCTHETNVSTDFYFTLSSYRRLASALVRGPSRPPAGGCTPAP